MNKKRFYIFFGLKLILKLLILFFWSFSSHAQMLDNSKGEAFTDRPYFNEDFVRNNKIKAINGRFTVKKVGDILRDTDLIKNFEFDEKGRLTRTFETTQGAFGKDTVVQLYEYDEKSRLKVIRMTDKHGFYATHYEYDDEDRVVRKELRRNLNAHKDLSNFELGKEFIVTFELSSYVKFDNQVKRTIRNSFDIPFKETIYYYDEHGVLVKEKDRIIRTSATTTKEYFYNEKGYMDSIAISSPKSQVKAKNYSYKYDDFDNLEVMEYYKDGVNTTEHQIIYDHKTALLKYILVKEVSTAYITILTIDEVEFFGG
jgi:hypothetical protein